MGHQLPYPPKLAIRIFRWYCRKDRVEELEGDLLELFYFRIENGSSVWKANAFFWWNILRCYKTYARTKTQKTMTMYPLFKSYFKLAIRHSWKNKWAVMINILGLGIALSMCLFTYSLHAYNLEFDSFFPDTDDVYRVNAWSFENGKERRNEISPLPLDGRLRNDIGGVQEVTSFFDRRLNFKLGNEYYEEMVGIVAPNFFEMFEIPLWYGSYSDFGNKPMVYLSQYTAKKLFGNEYALGQTLTLYVSSSKKMEVTVGGVLEKIPLNVSFDVNVFMSQNDYMKVAERSANDWDYPTYVSHFIRTSPENVKAIAAAMGESIPQMNKGERAYQLDRFELVPFKSKTHQGYHYYRSITNSRLTPTAPIIFTVLAAMVFLIGCFNLANTSMAMIAKRLKEIGVRKTLGSENRQILFQFLIEMGIICACAFIVGLSTVNMTSNFILGLFGVSFLLSDVQAIGVISFIVIFLCFTTLVAGIMPALYAWKFQPVAIMRKSVKLKGLSWFSKSLTVAQFSFSIAVLSAAISFSQNVSFLDRFNPGYENENIYVLNVSDQSKYTVLKDEINQLSGLQVAGTKNHIGYYSTNIQTITIDTLDTEVLAYRVGHGYLNLMNVGLVEGRNFSDGTIDQTKSLIINEEFANQFFEGKNVLQQVVKVDDERRSIVGVTNNLLTDLYEDAEIRPTIFILDTASTFRHLAIKVDEAQKEIAEANFKDIWNTHIDEPFQGQWQKDLAFGTATRDSENLRIIFSVMAFLGGFLSLVGIFSLAKLNVTKRIKEISIRKVLGSSLQQLLYVINRSFIIVLTIALVVGSALGYLLSDAVLQMIYKYYVNVTPMTSLLSALVIALFSLAMISLAIFVPAKANPVVGLRSE